MKNIFALDDDSLDLQDVLKRSVIETLAALDALLRFIDEYYRNTLVADWGTRNQIAEQIQGIHLALRPRPCVN